MYLVSLGILLFILSIGCDCSESTKYRTIKIEDANFWKELGNEELQATLAFKPRIGMAKNIILFVGDGMGLSTITAARIYQGQRNGVSGEEGYLTFERFPHTGLVKTYNIDKQVPDSAATATAIFSGVKANFCTVGLDYRSTFNVCDATIQEKAKLENLLTWAQKAGKDTGLVTNTRVTHATPAAWYATTPNRFWECDTKIDKIQSKKGCKDIARQLVEDSPGNKMKLILAGGQRQLRFKLALDANVDRTAMGCGRGDGRDLVKHWMDDKVQGGNIAHYVTNTEQLQSIDITKTDYLLGLFAPGHMAWEFERNKTPQGEPSLAEMTRSAIKMLQKNTNGYVLMIEGGRIDHAHHLNMAYRSLEEVHAFDEAVKMALDMTRNAKDTLIVVTADHSHTLTINGYPNRGNPIQGISEVDDSGFAFSTLSYANGPGYRYHRSQQGNGTDTKSTWRNITNDNFTDPNLRSLSAINEEISTHGGEDVPIYAVGPMAHLIHGVHEQTYPAYVMAFAACIGPYSNNCAKHYKNQGHLDISSNVVDYINEDPKPRTQRGNIATSIKSSLLNIFICITVILSCLLL